MWNDLAMAQRAYNCFRVLTFVPFSPHSGEKQRELTEIDERYVQKQRANRVRGGLAPPLPLEAGCGSVGRAGVGCGLRSILSGYSALWKHRTDREKRLPGPRATLSPASALGLSTRGKRRGDRATSGIQYARRGAAPGPPCPLHAGREGRHTVPRSLVLQIYGWRPCGRSGVVPEAVSEEPMRSSMSSS